MVLVQLLAVACLWPVGGKSRKAMVCPPPRDAGRDGGAARHPHSSFSPGQVDVESGGEFAPTWPRRIASCRHSGNARDKPFGQDCRTRRRSCSACWCSALLRSSSIGEDTRSGFRSVRNRHTRRQHMLSSSRHRRHAASPPRTSPTVNPAFPSATRALRPNKPFRRSRPWPSAASATAENSGDCRTEGPALKARQVVENARKAYGEAASQLTAFCRQRDEAARAGKWKSSVKPSTTPAMIDNPRGSICKSSFPRSSGVTTNCWSIVRRFIRQCKMLRPHGKHQGTDGRRRPRIPASQRT